VSRKELNLERVDHSNFEWEGVGTVSYTEKTTRRGGGRERVGAARFLSKGRNEGTLKHFKEGHESKREKSGSNGHR